MGALCAPVPYPVASFGPLFSVRSSRSALLGPLFSVRSSRSALLGPLFSVRSLWPVFLQFGFFREIVERDPTQPIIPSPKSAQCLNVRRERLILFVLRDE